MSELQASLLRDAAMNVPAMFLQTCMQLCETRSRAVAEYWHAVNAARRPEDVMEAQFDYWTALLRDYATAAGEGLSQTAGLQSRPEPEVRGRGRA